MLVDSSREIARVVGLPLCSLVEALKVGLSLTLELQSISIVQVLRGTRVELDPEDLSKFARRTRYHQISLCTAEYICIQQSFDLGLS